MNQSSSKGVFFQEVTDGHVMSGQGRTESGEHQSCGCARVTGRGHAALLSCRHSTCRFCCQVRGSSVKCFGTLTRTSRCDLIRGRKVLFAPFVSAFHLHRPHKQVLVQESYFSAPVSLHPQICFKFFFQTRLGRAIGCSERTMWIPSVFFCVL